MSKHCGFARVAYNFALSSFTAGREVGEWRSCYDLKKEFNAVKYDKFSWCEELSQNAGKNAIHNFDDAVDRWQKGQNRYPVHKKRSDKISYQADNGPDTIDIDGKRIYLPKIGWIRMREALRWQGQIRRVVVSKRNGKWFASILVNVDIVAEGKQSSLFHITPKQPIGVDVGIKTLATCSDGVVYENPRPLQWFLKKLRRANRSQSRKVQYSKNWQKAKKRLQAIHYRIACIRDDAHHKATTDIVRRASSIGIETLKITNLLKNKKIAKALSDSALGGFLSKLEYKADRHKVEIVKAGSFFASSKTCSRCGHKKEDLTLSDRTYHCSECDLRIDRDLNAAINLCPS